MSDHLITITVKLFAVYQETYGVSVLEWQFNPQTPVSQVLERAIEEHPELASWREITRFAINLEFVEPNTPLNAGDEVVLIPPVSGG